MEGRLNQRDQKGLGEESEIQLKQANLERSREDLGEESKVEESQIEEGGGLKFSNESKEIVSYGVKASLKTRITEQEQSGGEELKTEASED